MIGNWVTEDKLTGDRYYHMGAWPADVTCAACGVHTGEGITGIGWVVLAKAEEVEAAAAGQRKGYRGYITCARCLEKNFTSMHKPESEKEG